MSDLIERQAAIDKLRNNLAYMQAFGADRAVTLIEELPSAQPEKRTDKRTETHECDLIDRQEAIDAIDKALSRTFTKPCGEMILKDVPSAQPELIEKEAYIRGFEQGRTQGMIDSQGGKK